MTLVRAIVAVCLLAWVPVPSQAGPTGWEMGGIYRVQSSSGFIGNWGRGAGISVGAEYDLRPTLALVLRTSVLRYPYEGGHIGAVSIPECWHSWAGSPSTGIAFGAELRVIEPGAYKRFRGLVSFEFEIERFGFGRVMDDWTCMDGGGTTRGAGVHPESDQASVYGVLSLEIGQSVRLWDGKRLVIQSGVGVDDRGGRALVPLTIALQLTGRRDSM